MLQVLVHDRRKLVSVSAGWHDMSHDNDCVCTMHAVNKAKLTNAYSKSQEWMENWAHELPEKSSISVMLRLIS